MRVLLLFSGSVALAEALREAGAEVTTVDIEDGGADQDLARTRVSEHWLRRIDTGDFDVVLIATPCGSFSPNHSEAARSFISPEGVEALPPATQAYISYHNRLVRFSAAAVVAPAPHRLLWR